MTTWGWVGALGGGEIKWATWHTCVQKCITKITQKMPCQLRGPGAYYILKFGGVAPSPSANLHNVTNFWALKLYGFLGSLLT